jgi:YegS/Rv2252/BmrU family lipid kinase
MNYIFIINPYSGSKKTKKITNIINDHIAGSYKIVYTEYSGHASELAESFAKDNGNIVVAVGGDGTINEIARSLVNTNTVMGIIPSGSGNGFARSLNIPLDTVKAIECLNMPFIKTIDSGKINDKYFFGICGVGFDALVGAKFQDFGKRGPLPYFYIGVKEYFKYNYESYEIEENGNTDKYDPLLIAVANTSQYGNGASIAPQANPSDGYLDLCVLNKMKSGDAIKNIPLLFNGKIKQSPFYLHKRIKSIIIRRKNKKGYYHIDGEPFLYDGDLNITIVPSSLKVCVPLKHEKNE